MILKGLSVIVQSGDSMIDVALENFLTKLGCTVATENSVEKAADCDVQIAGMAVHQTISQQKFNTSPNPKATVLLGAASEKNAMIEALMNGVDDFIITPIDPSELHARLIALSRKLTGYGLTVRSEERLKIFGHTLDASRSGLTTETGTFIPLSRIELRVFWALARLPERIVSRRKMLDLVYDSTTDVSDRMVDYHICKIRGKLVANSVQLRISTKRGQGYLLELSTSCA